VNSTGHQASADRLGLQTLHLYAAFDKGLTPATIIVDEPIEYEYKKRTWQPQNFDRKFNGRRP